jgi:hypothetical protein
LVAKKAIITTPLSKKYKKEMIWRHFGVNMRIFNHGLPKQHNAKWHDLSFTYLLKP